MQTDGGANSGSTDLDFESFHSCFVRFKKLANLPQVLARIRRRESSRIRPGWLVLTNETNKFAEEITGVVIKVYAVDGNGKQVCALAVRICLDRVVAFH